MRLDVQKKKLEVAKLKSELLGSRIDLFMKPLQLATPLILAIGIYFYIQQPQIEDEATSSCFEHVTFLMEMGEKGNKLTGNVDLLGTFVNFPMCESATSFVKSMISEQELIISAEIRNAIEGSLEIITTGILEIPDAADFDLRDLGAISAEIEELTASFVGDCLTFPNTEEPGFDIVSFNAELATDLAIMREINVDIADLFELPILPDINLLDRSDPDSLTIVQEALETRLSDMDVIGVRSNMIQMKYTLPSDQCDD